MILNSTQSGVARGMVAAVVITIVVLASAYFLQWPSLTCQSTVALRLKLAAIAALWPTAALFLCIARLAKHRFSTPQDIQGSALTEGTVRAKLLQALLQNTLEQAVLAIPVYFAAALFFPASLLSLLAAAATLFFIGRILFFHGYASGAPSRAIGFGLTFYPSVALLFLVIVVAALQVTA